MKKLVLGLSLLLAPATLAGCNAGALAVASYAQTSLSATDTSGQISNGPTNTRIGYITWIEMLKDGSVTGKLNFDLVRDKMVDFEGHVTTPNNGRFDLKVTPKSDQAVEGTYVVFAWDDLNGNGIYEGDQGEKRAPEVYRVRGQAGARSYWTIEKLVFTDKKLAIEYADQGGVNFIF